MYAGTSIITNSEYAELAIKANKYDEMQEQNYKEIVEKAKIYDILRADVLDSSYISISDRQLFGITDEEIQAHKEKENK